MGFFRIPNVLPEVFQVAAGPRLFSSKQRSIFWCGGLVEPGEPAAEPSLKSGPLPVVSRVISYKSQLHL